MLIHEIESLEASLYDDWLDLYQSSFPLNEQLLVSEHNRVLREKAAGRAEHKHLLSAVDSEGRLAAMARCDAMPEKQAAVLWYLAVAPASRCSGIGSQFYQAIRERILSECPNLDALLIEVEDPARAESAKQRELAARRIAFYQRLGARQLQGIRYIQSVGWQEPVEMLLLVHPFKDDLTAQAVFDCTASVFGEAVRQTGPLSLDP